MITYLVVVVIVSINLIIRMKNLVRFVIWVQNGNMMERIS